jgi:mono/diheme cytochrome c family protein
VGLGVALEKFLSELGKTVWLRRTFFASPAQRFAWASVLLLVTLAIAPTKDFFNEWRHYQRQYMTFISARPDGAELQRHFAGGIQQIWLPDLGVVDRCTTCHLAVTEKSLQHATGVPEPFQAHPSVGHNVKDWGCVVCHRGQGPATNVVEAHNATRAWEQPLIPVKYIQGSCGSCHQGELAQAPQLMRGREMLTRLNCQGCHKLNNLESPSLGPDLSNVGYKVSRAWIYKWLKEPRTVVDKDGSTIVNGYESGDESRMPQYRLNEEELRALSAYVSVQKATPLQAYKINPRVVAAWSKKPDLVSQGEERFRQLMCTTCHPVAVTRAGETKLIGGNIAPELTKVGSKVNEEWLVSWLHDPKSYLANSEMPRYGWTDEELYKVSQYVMNKLTDTDLLNNIPQLGPATDQEIKNGERTFLEKGCATCHSLQRVAPQKDFGPDLTAMGTKNTSELEFGKSKVPYSLVSYIQAKLQDPTSVIATARMPRYTWNQADLDAVTTALLSQTGQPATTALQNLVVPKKSRSFQAVGAFAEVYERYKCYACHRFNGYGATLAPDLSYEGSQAQKKWIYDFLKNPQTVRPALILRMPQFNMTDKEATILAEYLSLAMQKPGVGSESVDSKQFTPSMVAAGQRLYQTKYQCQSCHTIGKSGGYVGPNLNNAGNWLTPAWTEAWLRDPQELQPGTIEPKRELREEEVRNLTAYLMTLRTGIKSEAVGGAAKAALPTEEQGDE